MADRPSIAIAAQGSGPLTPLQVRTLAVEARRAFEAQRKLGLAEESFDAWRHGAVQDAAPGRHGLRDLTQADFAPVRAWLRELADGQRAGCFRSPAADDNARRARWTLRREMAARSRIFGGPDGVESYVADLFRRIHGTTMEEASAKQIWQVCYTLRNRANAKSGNRWGSGSFVVRPSATHPGNRVGSAGRGGRPENGQSAVPGAPRVFPLVSRDGTGLSGEGGTP